MNQENNNLILNINTLRLLSVDMIENAKSGHPGMPLGCSPMLYILFSRFLSITSKNPLWINRDRFILSNGHGCSLLYSLLHLLEFNISIDDLKNFRKINSITPGHPEMNLSNGIEVTTGPLGQGIANGVGMAIGMKNLASRFNTNIEVFNNKIYVSCGDGCLMEGISNEAMSLAGHLKLDNLIILYDDNNISIDGTTDLTFTEDVTMKYKAMGWEVFCVEDANENFDDIISVFEKSIKSIKPVLIRFKTKIGYGSNKEGSEKSHGSPLGPEAVVNLKNKFNFDEKLKFYIPDKVKENFKNICKLKFGLYEEWVKNYNIYMNKYPEKFKELQQFYKMDIDDNLFPKYDFNDNPMATRQTSGKCLQSIYNSIPQLIGGSADLSPSNNTMIDTAIQSNNYNGRYIHYGVREHAMCAIANGLSNCGFIPYVGTFLVFINYCLCAIRMSALSGHKVIYILTHDSIGLGEDGPTHQPIESLTILRSIPNLLTIRPADGNEVSGAYKVALKAKNKPSCLCLSRQKLPHLEYSDINSVLLGGYTMIKGKDIIIVATGSEVSLAIDIIKELKDINCGLVSMPCCELFDIQTTEYKKTVLPDNIIKLSIEAGSTIGWYKYVDHCIGIDTFGASGSGNEIMKYFGFDKEKIILFILKILNK